MQQELASPVVGIGQTAAAKIEAIHKFIVTGIVLLMTGVCR
jgi:hypothetical protein